MEGLFSLAHMLDNTKIDGMVLSIDIGSESKAEHPKIKKFNGTSVSALIFRNIQDEIWDGARVMAILDSDHSTENVLKEMQIYSTLVTPGCYMVVMDSNLRRESD